MIKSKVIVNYIVFLIIVLSGNVFFSLKYVKETRYILYFSALSILLYSFIKNDDKFDRKSLLQVFIINSAFSVNFFLNSQNGMNIKNFEFLVAITFSIYILKYKIDINCYKKSYVNIMAVICVVSLICYTLSNFIPESKFPFYRKELLGVDVYKYSFYHCWGYGIGTTRNAGMFWEPGAFQCYINLALVILFFDKNIDIYANRKCKTGLFFVTLLTTQSTTGYIVSAIIVLVYIFQNKRDNKNLIFKIVSIITSLLCISLVLNSNIVSNKFDNNNTSYSIRKNDFEESINIIMENTIKGIGYVSKKQAKEQNNRNIEKNSNGLLIIIIQFGVVYAIMYIIFMFNGIKRLLKCSILESFIVLIIFCIMFNSEAIILYPCWIYFML